MSTHFLIEGADTAAYRDLKGIKAELRSYSFIHPPSSTQQPVEELQVRDLM